MHEQVLPEALLEAAKAPADQVQRTIITLDEIGLMNFTPDQLRQFEKGHPTLVHAAFFTHRGKRSTGGQHNDALEKAIKVALASTVYCVVEKIRHLIAIRDKRTFSKEQAGREAAIQALTASWLKDDVRNTEELRRKHLDTLWEKGRRPQNWKSLFAVEHLSKSATRWASRFDKTAASIVDKEIEFQKSLVIGLLHCESRAAMLRAAISTISDKVAKGLEEPAWERIVLAAGGPDLHRSITDVLPAAFSSDVNPADLFPRLESAREHFDTMRVIGRLHRGLPAKFTYNDMLILAHPLKLLEIWMAKPWEEKTAADVEHAFWTKAMRSVMSLDEWQRLFHVAYPATKNGEDFVVQRQMD